MSTREAIVAAATALVDRDRAVTLRAVSREAGLPTSSIYPHFPDCAAILRAVCHAAFAELSAAVLSASDVHAAGLAYLDFAALHPRRYRVMFGVLDLAEPAFRLFTGYTANALALWLGLHGLADQRASFRRSPVLSALAPRLIASLS
ncbi:TetR/AcrR family transcriptional regulator [Lentzea sp. NPDC051213]|uniref:TetR/AcrR family transcriptional regulator n=1 Tax=Lentzea sp. NPDC051213 TaxID=3364126 RepID=UPI0037AEA845